jgi:hypothetical protein
MSSTRFYLAVAVFVSERLQKRDERALVFGRKFNPNRWPGMGRARVSGGFQPFGR